MPISVEYVTHGGFEMVRDAWLFVSHLFNDPDYRALVTTVYVASISLMAIFSLIQAPFRRYSVHGWMWMALVAVMVWTMFFNVSNFGSWNLSGEVVVFDDIKNKSQPISGIPPGLAYLAGMVNKVQVGLEDKIDAILTGASISNTSEMVIGVKMLREAREGMLMGPWPRFSTYGLPTPFTGTSMIALPRRRWQDRSSVRSSIVPWTSSVTCLPRRPIRPSTPSPTSILPGIP